MKLMRKLLKKQGFAPDVLVTDKLRSYGAAKAEMGLSTCHEQGLRKNNRAENSHQPIDGASAKCIASNCPTAQRSSPFTPPSTTPSTSAPSRLPPHAPRPPRRSVPDLASRHRGLSQNWDFQIVRGQIPFA